MSDSIIGAEYSVIGSILIDARCLPEIMECVTPDDFTLDINRRIYQAALELDRRDEPIDPVTIKTEIGNDASDKYLLELMEVTGTSVNAGVYAAEVRRASIRRKLMDLSFSLQERASTLEPPVAIIADAHRTLDDIESKDTAKELASSSDVLMAFYEHREKVESGKGGFVKTGFKGLDRILGGGLLNSGFYIMAARPGMGKTTMAISVAENVAYFGPVLFVSLEMDVEQIAAKRLARAAGVTYDNLMFNKLTNEEMDRVVEHSSKLSTKKFFVNKKASATVDDIATMARKVKGLRLVVVDYFGLIRSTSERKSRTEAMTEISGQLKALARKLKVPILCLAQINRENTKRENKRPQLSDLRDTGALEQDADGVIFLHCPSYYSDEPVDAWEPDEMEIIVAKNRHAGTGICRAGFYRAVGRIIPAMDGR